MRWRGALAIALVLLTTVGTWATPLAGPADATPVKQTQFHIETFVDGAEELVGLADSGHHLVAELLVPAGSKVLRASLEVSRVRYETTELPLDAAPRTLWCGDLDRDGVSDDLVVAYPKAGRVDLLNLAGEPPVLITRGSMEVPDAMAVVVADLDRDNDRDILVTSGCEGRVYIFEALAVDTYAEARVVPVGPRPGALAVNDLDPDFKRDVVVANSGGSSVTILMGKGAFGFYPKRVEVGKGPSAVQLRDMDKDLDVDLVVAESRNNTVSVFYNAGNGNFTISTTLPTGEGPVGLDVRDVNGDSLMDISVACSGSGEVWVYFQRPGGIYELVEVLPVGEAPRAVRALQANRKEDANMDIVTVCSGSDNVTVYLAGGDLDHTIPVDLPVGGRPVALASLQGGRGEDDTLVVACQDPPSLVLAYPLQVADAMWVGFGPKGSLDKVELLPGTESTVVPISEPLLNYLYAHDVDAVAGHVRVPIHVWATKAGWLRVSGLDVWVQPNRPPRADAGRDIVVTLGERAELNGSHSYDPDGGFIGFMWMLPGDTVRSYTARVSYHVFDEPGKHMVLLVVVDQWGLRDQDMLEVVVNAPPVAKGDVPATVRAREPTRLSAHLSEDPDGSIVDYVWDYSQGVVHGRMVDVMFTGTGTRNVTLEVIDDLGARSVATFQVEVLPARTPLREPAEVVPEDEGVIPGPGVLLSAMAIVSAAALAGARGRRDRRDWRGRP